MKKGGKCERVRENKRKLQDGGKNENKKIREEKMRKEKEEKELKQRKQEEYKREAGHEMEGRTIFKFEKESFRRRIQMEAITKERRRRV